MEQSPQELIVRHTQSIGIALSEKQAGLLAKFLVQLQEWNTKANLTSITKTEEIVIKHFVDSVAVLNALTIGTGAKILDIGTGAGFPGIPLKIVRSDLEMTLLEPVQKKATFLQYIVGLLQLQNVTVFCGTLTDFISKNIPSVRFDYILCRALKYDIILDPCRDITSENGKCLLYLAKSISHLNMGPHWSHESEYAFTLPENVGSRVISILAPTNKFHVEHR